LTRRCIPSQCLLLAPRRTSLLPLPLHDALPILPDTPINPIIGNITNPMLEGLVNSEPIIAPNGMVAAIPSTNTTIRNSTSNGPRSEEHTSELQSRFDIVCRLLLDKTKRSDKSNP